MAEPLLETLHEPYASAGTFLDISTPNLSLSIYIYIYIWIVKNVSFFRCSAAAKYFAAKILYPQLIFAVALLNFAAILLSTEGDP